MHDHEPAQIVLDGSFTQSKSVHSLRLSLDCTENRKSLRLTFLGLVFSSQDPQIRISTNVKLKLSLRVLFRHLKIILLQ